MENTQKSSSISIKLLDELSFELRTLLNGFSGPIQLLKSRVDDPALVDIFRMLDSSLSRLERLTQRSALILNIDSDFFSLAKEKINLADAVKYSVWELQNISNLENIVIDIENSNNDIKIDGNLDLLIQIFEVLIENVISISEANSTIKISFNDFKTEFVCSITSLTATIPTELNSTFEFVNGVNSTSWDMLMVHKLLELHRATIKVVSSNGKPNTIEVKFNKTAE